MLPSVQMANESFDYWHETALATGQLRGCLMAPLGCIVYVGGFIALVVWGNSILILLLWMLFVGPIAVGLVALAATFLVFPVAAALMFMAKIFHWGEKQ